MKNYNTLSLKMEDYFIEFIKKLTKGFGKVQTKFIGDMVNGINSNNSVVLSEIARAISNNVNIKKTVDRFDRHLDSFTEDYSGILEENYVQLVKSYINARKLYYVDGSDIVKDVYTKFENKGNVLDGSKGHEKAYGYNLFDIVTIDNSNQPISLQSDLFSSKDTDFDSYNLRWINLIEKTVKNYGSGTIIADRGFDSAILYDKIMKTGSDFIVRVNQRDICYVNGKKESIKEIVSKAKGKYAITRRIKGKNYNLKVSYKQINIKSHEAKELKDKVMTLVIVKGYADGSDSQSKDPAMVLLTSKLVVGKNEVIQIVNDYTSRWKIEEFFKYKKQQFGLENIRVRRYKRIQALNRILTISMFLSNFINMKTISKTVRKIKIQIRKYVAFKLYRISDGIKEILKINRGILMSKLYPPRQKRNRNLWTVMNVRFNY